ncbi:MAG: sigma-70 family RNA polymerase sigma factor [Candidatus Uhrbacteria bacterium]
MDEKSSDFELAVACRNGDTTALRLVVERYQGRVFELVCCSIVGSGDLEDARDITQDVFIEFFRSCDELDEREMRFVHIVLFRRALRKSVKHISAEVPHGSLALAVSTCCSMSTPRRPDEDAWRNELYRHIMEAVQTLDPDTREVFLLREIEGLSYKEIADTMEVPLGTVCSRMFRARVALREQLSDLH